MLCLVTQSCPTLCAPMDCSPQGSSVHGDSPGKNTGLGCHALLQGIFPTQGSNPGLLHCRQILCQLSYQGSPWSTHIYIHNMLSVVHSFLCCIIFHCVNTAQYIQFPLGTFSTNTSMYILLVYTYFHRPVSLTTEEFCHSPLYTSFLICKTWMIVSTSMGSYED